MALPLVTAELGAKVVQGAKHWILTTIRVVAVLSVVTLILWSIYVTVVRPHTKPTPTTTENANIIYHFNINLPAKRTFGLGGTLWGMDVGVVKYDFTTITATVIKEVVKADSSIDANTLVEKVKDTVNKEVEKAKQKKWYFLWLL